MDIQRNVEEIRTGIEEALTKANRPKDSVKLVAVTKTVDSQTAQTLIKEGIDHIAENRVDKFLEKYEALKDQEVTWHLIGTLQRRKVKDVINLVDYFHALDSLRLAQEINKRAEHTIHCFLQVNISKEESKHGVYIEDLDQLLPELAQCQNIQIDGLMTMAPFDATDQELDQIFGRMQALQKELQAKQFENMPFTELSMGMSRDYEKAIEHGATFIRIGTSFFK